MDLKALRARLRPAWPVMDVHVHPLSGSLSNVSPRQAAQLLIAEADRTGVTRMVISNLGRTWDRSPDPAAIRAANDDCLRVRDHAPERFTCFCYLNPAHPEESIAELDRCVKQNGMAGVKLWVALRANDPRVKTVAEHAVALDVPILQHVWLKAGGNEPGESTPSDLAVLARAVPHARLIAAHLAGCLRGIEEVAGLPNIAIETGGTDPERGIVEAAVRRLGSRRVIFGSDVRGRHFGTQLGKVLGAELSDVTKKRILWDNLARLLPASAGVRPSGDETPAPEDLQR
jgi:uncharacterized protein